MDVTITVRHGYHFGAKPHGLLCGILGHIARAGNHHGLALERLTAGGKHSLGEIAGTIACGFRPQKTASPTLTLAGHGTCPFVAQTLVLAEHVAYFASADSNISCRDIGVRTYMSLKLSHKALAETHHLSIGLAARTEIGTAFGPAHRKGCKCVLEGLLKGKELHYAQIHTGMEAYASLVWTYCAVHLHTETTVDVDLSFVIHPWNTEDDDPFRFNHSLHYLVVKQVRICLQARGNAFQHLPYCLMKFFFSGILRFQLRHKGSDVLFSKL